jgi:hypothetical protein
MTSCILVLLWVVTKFSVEPGAPICRVEVIIEAVACVGGTHMDNNCQSQLFFILDILVQQMKRPPKAEYLQENLHSHLVLLYYFNPNHIKAIYELLTLSHLLDLA